MIGTTAGIGAAMTNRLVQEGAKVIAVGRRQDRLDEFVSKHGKDKAGAVKYDLSDSRDMDSFVSKCAKPHPQATYLERETGAHNADHAPASLLYTPTWTVSSSTPASRTSSTSPSPKSSTLISIARSGPSTTPPLST